MRCAFCTILLTLVGLFATTTARYTSEELAERERTTMSETTTVQRSQEAERRHRLRTNADAPMYGHSYGAQAGVPNPAYHFGSHGVHSPVSPCPSAGCAYPNSPASYPAHREQPPFHNRHPYPPQRIHNPAAPAAGCIETSCRHPDPLRFGGGSDVRTDRRPSAHRDDPAVDGSNGIDLRFGGSSNDANNWYPPTANSATASYPPQPPVQDNRYPQQTQQNGNGHHREPHSHHGQHHGYQGNRGYSTLDHSLKMQTEYTEDGHHVGPFQGNNNGLGYGSGYGSYNGAFNRPGF